jgi:sugar/nucleoside kinase (ribokinase family)
MIDLDYLVIGHITRDLVQDGFAIGGTVSFAARTARAIGRRTGIITSVSPDLEFDGALDGVAISRHSSATTTTFQNINTPQGRRQVLYETADKLVPAMIPPKWRVDPAQGVVHLGPVAQECDVALLDAFGDVFIGLTPQGWMRCWDHDGYVSRCTWEGAEPLLARADAVVLSDEDLGDKGLSSHYADRTRLLVVTHGAKGCTVHTGGTSRDLPAPGVVEVDATGAGDVFAAAFFIWLRQSGDPWAAALFANCVAAQSVTRKGLSGTPTLEEVASCQRMAVEGNQ